MINGVKSKKLLGKALPKQAFTKTSFSQKLVLVKLFPKALGKTFKIII